MKSEDIYRIVKSGLRLFKKVAVFRWEPDCNLEKFMTIVTISIDSKGRVLKQVLISKLLLDK